MTVQLVVAPALIIGVDVTCRLFSQLARFIVAPCNDTHGNREDLIPHTRGCTKNVLPVVRVWRTKVPPSAGAHWGKQALLGLSDFRRVETRQNEKQNEKARGCLSYSVDFDGVGAPYCLLPHGRWRCQLGLSFDSLDHG